MTRTIRMFAIMSAFVGALSGMGCAPDDEALLADLSVSDQTLIGDLGLRWSYDGAIPGMVCTRWYEGADPDTWWDNWLCAPSDLGLRWSSAGPIGGMVCTHIIEGADPHTWLDNYLCAPRDLGLAWNSSGPIAGKQCLQIKEPADPHTWNDNYLCWASSGGGGGGGNGEANPGGSGYTCDQWGLVWLGDRRYFYNNNIWNGPSGSQCASVNGTSFRMDVSKHGLGTAGPPAAYGSFVKGCHYGNCTNGHGMLRPIRDIAHMPSSFHIAPAGGSWNASYDIWFDPTPRTQGSNTGLELMIWVNYSGGVQPIGSRVATVAIAGADWEVWHGHNGYSPVVSYRRSSSSNANDFDIKAFTNDATGRGYLKSEWFVTSVQAGFEIWQGGTGLRADRFSVLAQ